jgi:hypothetical protein
VSQHRKSMNKGWETRAWGDVGCTPHGQTIRDPTPAHTSYLQSSDLREVRFLALQCKG